MAVGVKAPIQEQLDTLRREQELQKEVLAAMAETLAQLLGQAKARAAGSVHCIACAQPRDTSPPRGALGIDNKLYPFVASGGDGEDARQQEEGLGAPQEAALLGGGALARLRSTPAAIPSAPKISTQQGVQSVAHALSPFHARQMGALMAQGQLPRGGAKPLLRRAQAPDIAASSPVLPGREHYVLGPERLPPATMQPQGGTLARGRPPGSGVPGGGGTRPASPGLATLAQDGQQGSRQRPWSASAAPGRFGDKEPLREEWRAAGWTALKDGKAP